MAHMHLLVLEVAGSDEHVICRLRVEVALIARTGRLLPSWDGVADAIHTSMIGTDITIRRST
eukprot:1006909-Amphidinium_carterae.1